MRSFLGAALSYTGSLLVIVHGITLTAAVAGAFLLLSRSRIDQLWCFSSLLFSGRYGRWLPLASSPSLHIPSAKAGPIALPRHRLLVPFFHCPTCVPSPSTLRLNRPSTASCSSRMARRRLSTIGPLGACGLTRFYSQSCFLRIHACSVRRYRIFYLGFPLSLL